MIDWVPALHLVGGIGSGLVLASAFLLQQRLQPDTREFILWCGLYPGTLLATLAYVGLLLAT